ncbi:30S ribosomal protein S15 [Candidatus Babeliales bacterium]|nr:30S ribosomal protein S15 [Candidatus Babeliales bacterium]
MLSKENTAQDALLGKVKKHDDDTGSVEVQVIRLSHEIDRLTEHFKLFPKDYDSKRGLLQKVARRKRFLGYLQKKDRKLFDKLVQELGIRQKAL